ncbi:hypothetical protein [Lysinibacillus sphaericus]|nr:hypothetical protein [Lysinibacillus sphaericus]
MIKATKIKMYEGKEKSNSVLEIDQIYLTGVEKKDFTKRKYP